MSYVYGIKLLTLLPINNDHCSVFEKNWYDDFDESPQSCKNTCICVYAYMCVYVYVYVYSIEDS